MIYSVIKGFARLWGGVGVRGSEGRQAKEDQVRYIGGLG